MFRWVFVVFWEDVDDMLDLFMDLRMVFLFEDM